MTKQVNIALAGSLAALLIATPAAAITVREAQHTSDGRSKLVDPDEQVERLSDRARVRSIRGGYDRDSAQSVMRFGNQAGQGVSARPLGF